ncbi:MAG: hypothetical protein ACOVOS_01265 [Chitinophagaceae bacterium]|jgi:hypothetical protein
MMNALVKKLQYKLQSLVLITHAPDTFADAMDAFAATADVHTEPRKGTSYAFVIHFVQKPADVQKAAKMISSSLEADGVLWMAYPKKTSKKYKAEITRDDGWQALEDHGFEPVTLVSIDDDWSALRFRKVDFIKTMTRRTEMTLSKEGKQKTSGKK